MDILEKLKLRIEFEKVQSCLFYKEGKLNVNLLRTYTIDTINHLLLNYNEDHEFVQILNKVKFDLDRSTRIICLDFPANETERDTVVDFIFDENTLVGSDDIFDTLCEFDLFDDTLPGINQSDIERITAENHEKVFCHIGYKVEDTEVLCKSENQDFISSSTNYLIVCDGVGSGINSKDISAFIGNQFSKFIESFHVNLKSINEFSRSSFIQQGVYLLNQQLVNLMKSNEFNDGNSGTTMSSAIKISTNAYHICSIGDSPVYLFDLFKGFYKLNSDDTLISKLQKKGFFHKSPLENDLTISFLRSMWPNKSDENLYSMANQCIVKSFGFKPDAVTFSNSNNQTLQVENSSGIIICSDGISDQFEDEIFYNLILLGGIKEMITEYNLILYSEFFNYSDMFIRDILNRNILDFTNISDIKRIYDKISSRLFLTYGFQIKNVVFKGAIKEVSKEALLVMQNKRLTTQNKPYPGFKKPKSDNIAIGYLI
ncbi:hypothetical protein HOL52_01520 [bacterium]|jgi:serine/threonine protein phosphatase PrpC|nr:hypothetical protein [bacterium]